MSPSIPEAAPPLNRSTLLTASRMRSYLTCARKHEIEYSLGYRPVLTADALYFGTLWHRVLESYFLCAMAIQHDPKKGAWSGDDYADCYSHALNKIGGAVETPPAPGSIVSGEDPIDPFVGARLAALLYAYDKSLRRYQFLEGHEILAVELPFKFPHINPATTRVSPLWERAGKIDVVARHKSGRIRVVEHKTTNDPIEADTTYWQALLLDTQISQYVLGTEAAFGENVDECVYDVVRKFGIKPLKATPKENWRWKKRTKAQVEEGLPEDDPSLLYANIRMEDEKPSEFLQRCKDEVDADLDRWHRMLVIARTDGMIYEHMQNAWSIATAMRHDEKSKFSMKNPDACHRFGTCPFWGVCTKSQSLDDPRWFRKLGDVHPELRTKRSANNQGGIAS